MKKKDLTEEYLLDMWLGKYHNTSIQQLLKENPEWEEHPQEHTREFYDKYRVTEEQHDEWYAEAISVIQKVFKMSKKTAKRNFTFTYLNVAPSINKK